MAAAESLARDWGIASEVFSATSFALLARDADEVERWNRLHPDEAPRRSHLGTQLQANTLTVAATDYVRAYPQLIAPYIDARYVCLGTDGFGRSDTRVALRRFFEVDQASIVVATLHALAELGQIGRICVPDAIARYQLDTDAPAPWTR